MLTTAVIHSRPPLKADYEFFFKNKSKADADLDLFLITFADSWEAAALQDDVISFRIPSRRRYDENWCSQLPHPVCSLSERTTEENGLAFPLIAAQACGLGLPSPTLCHGQLI